MSHAETRHENAGKAEAVEHQHRDADLQHGGEREDGNLQKMKLKLPKLRYFFLDIDLGNRLSYLLFWLQNYEGFVNT